MSRKIIISRMNCYKIKNSNILIIIREEEAVLPKSCSICGNHKGINLVFYNTSNEIILHPDCGKKVMKELNKKEDQGYIINYDIKKSKIGFYNNFSLNLNCPICKEDMSGSDEIVRIGSKESISSRAGVYFHKSCLCEEYSEIENKIEKIIPEVMSSLI